MTRLFVDSSFLVALEDLSDQNHAAAVRFWATIPKSAELISTTFVLDEVVTFFNSRGMHAKALSVGRRMLDSTTLQVAAVGMELARAAFEYLARRPDKRYSLTDCVSFLVMERRSLTDVLTFDAHFTQAGFVRLPLASA
jgi:predicted nucleic acid-binding protein